jgi:hypothetical protein
MSLDDGDTQPHEIYRVDSGRSQPHRRGGDPQDPEAHRARFPPAPRGDPGLDGGAPEGAQPLRLRHLRGTAEGRAGGAPQERHRSRLRDHHCPPLLRPRHHQGRARRHHPHRQRARPLPRGRHRPVTVRPGLPGPARQDATARRAAPARSPAGAPPCRDLHRLPAQVPLPGLRPGRAPRRRPVPAMPHARTASLAGGSGAEDPLPRSPAHDGKLASDGRRGYAGAAADPAAPRPFVTSRSRSSSFPAQRTTISAIPSWRWRS